MKELKVGKITLRELSEWFGLKPDTISKSKQETREKKFKVLEAFADYHFEGKKIIIDKVKIPVYSRAYEIIEKNFDDTWGNVVDEDGHPTWQKEENVDTCARVGATLYYKHKEINTQISIKTSRVYTNNVKVSKYGHNFGDDHGDVGRAESVYTTSDRKKLLTDEQLEIIKQCKKDAYASFGEKVAEIDEAFHQNEITEEERNEQIGQLSTEENYFTYLELLYERLGFLPERMTRLVKENYFE